MLGMTDESILPRIADALAAATTLLRDNEIDEPRRVAQTLLGFVLNRACTYLVVHSDEQLSADELERFQVCVQRRAAGEPVQHITGRQEFYNLEFEVTPDVLIPRPETEMLVEAGLELLAKTETNHAPRFCDVGTGSGCITISLLHNHRNACGVALDVSPAALAVARRNAARHNVAERAQFIESDLFANLASDERFDFIVSNPPYIATDELPTLGREVREFEPHLALTPGADGLAIVRRLLAESPARLRSGGSLIFEIGYGQEAQVRELVDGRVWHLDAVRADLQDIPRVFILRLALGLRVMCGGYWFSPRRHRVRRGGTEEDKS